MALFRPLLRRAYHRVATTATSVAREAIASAAKDIDIARQTVARDETAEFVETELGHLTGFRGRTATEAREQLLKFAVERAPRSGLVVEFGVAAGDSLRILASMRSEVHGFDSFEGLPEHWRAGYGAGAFSQQPPDVRGATMHVGWFDDTLPAFLASHHGPFALVHMDADLYSSTATVFELAYERFVPGTVIVFDEYFNYPGWREHEHRAFTEFRARYSGGFEYLAYNAMHEQVAVILT